MLAITVLQNGQNYHDDPYLSLNPSSTYCIASQKSFFFSQPSISDQEEVNHKQAETPDQAIENSAEMQHTTSEPSTFTESQPSSSTADKRQDTGSQPSSSMADKQQDTGPQPSSSMADKRQERMRKLHELRLRKVNKSTSVSINIF